MSSLYYKHQLQEAYNSWKATVNASSDLLDNLDKEIKYVEDPKEKALFQRRIKILDDNLDKQIDLINLLYVYISEHTVSKDHLTYTKEKLEIARKFIASLGGDPSSLNWLQKSDFYR
jgi:hypothetical protein